MVQLFEKQLGVMREYYKRGATGEEFGYNLLSLGSPQRH
jgi:hypothetical protein